MKPANSKAIPSSLLSEKFLARYSSVPFEEKILCLLVALSEATHFSVNICDESGVSHEAQLTLAKSASLHPDEVPLLKLFRSLPSCYKAHCLEAMSNETPITLVVGVSLCLANRGIQVTSAVSRDELMIAISEAIAALKA